MKFGPGPRGYLGTIGQYALGSGASFGFFMMIGSCIRTDDSVLSAEDRATLRAGMERWRVPVSPMAYYFAQNAKAQPK
ncbi:subunit of TIM23 translocase complex [Coemansia sp. RSA 2131]|nr:subunit of TIM23 translocase complex [Coemansia sp. RSA 2131]